MYLEALNVRMSVTDDHVKDVRRPLSSAAYIVVKVRPGINLNTLVMDSFALGQGYTFYNQAQADPAHWNIFRSWDPIKCG